MKNDTVVCYSN